MDFITHLRIVRATTQPDTPLYPPVLALGMFERVGSNWFLDTFSDTVHAHNEPFRQQLGDHHPTSALAHTLTLLKETDGSALMPYERFWFEEFYLSKFAASTQLIKETNLFFTLENFLDIFSDSPVIILTRHPAGIADSFFKRNLFTRWGYAERYEQMRALVKTERYQDFYTPESYKDPLGRLGYLIGLHALIVARHAPQDSLVVAYEANDAERAEAITQTATLLGSSSIEVKTASTMHAKADDTTMFTTTKPRSVSERQSTVLSEIDYEVLHTAIEAIFAGVSETIATATIARARSLLFSHGDYRFSPVSCLVKGEQRPEEVATIPALAPPRYIPMEATGLLLRTTLVTNEEFCDFLNRMNENGVSNIVQGMNFMFNENMPYSRGGRIVFSPKVGKYVVQAGYQHHPVYWVTWFGASIYAAFAGAHLPSINDLHREYSTAEINYTSINAEYKVGDVVSVIEPSHLVAGNLATWCADGPSSAAKQPKLRYFSGIAWNKPATKEELLRRRSRSVVGNSRSVGIRLIRGKDENSEISLERATAVAREYLAAIKSADVL